MRNRPVLRNVKVPWLIVLGIVVLFVVVDVALGHGLRDLIAGWVGTGTGASDLLRVSAVGAGAARDRCRRTGVTISVWRVAWQGAVCAVVATFAATLALALT